MTKVTLTPVTPAGAAVVGYRTDVDVLAGGFGGWESVSRTRRPAGAGWLGGTQQTLTIPLVLSGLEVRPGVDRSVEVYCDRLLSWGLATKATGVPPVLKVTGPTQAPPGSKWVLNDLTWNDRTRNAKESRIQQYVSVVLMRYVAADVLGGGSPAKRSRDRNKHKRPVATASPFRTRSGATGSS